MNQFTPAIQEKFVRGGARASPLTSLRDVEVRNRSQESECEIFGALRITGYAATESRFRTRVLRSASDRVWINAASMRCVLRWIARSISSLEKTNPLLAPAPL